MAKHLSMKSRKPFRNRISAGVLLPLILSFVYLVGISHASSEPELGFISGEVVDAGTGLPIVGAAVQIFDSSGRFITYVLTDESGDYHFRDGLPSGFYFANVSNQDGYFDEVYDNFLCTPIYCDPTLGRPIRVSAGTTTEGINFALEPGGRISGRLTDAVAGAPIGGVLLTFHDTVGSFIGWIDTDANGRYITPWGLPDGNYYVVTRNSEGYFDEIYDNQPCSLVSCEANSGTPVTVTAEYTTNGIDFSLSPGGRIAGSVTDEATGNPISDFSVDIEIYDVAGNLVSGGRPDINGNYISYKGLSEGSYFVVAHLRTRYLYELYELYDNLPCSAGCNPTLGTPVMVNGTETTNGINFVLRFEPDYDSDGVLDPVDNCIEIANPDQRDTDSDGYGNICDADFDNQLLVEFSDLAYLKSKMLTSDPDADLNGSGKVDAVDLLLLQDQFFAPPGPSGLVSSF